VIPVVLRCVDAVTDEDDRSVDLRALRVSLVSSNKFVGKFQRNLGARLGRKGELRLFAICGNTIKTDVLKIPAVLAGGSQAVALELRRNPVGGGIPAFLPGTAAFKAVVGKMLDGCANLLGIDTIHGLGSIGGKTGRRGGKQSDRQHEQGSKFSH